MRISIVLLLVIDHPIVSEMTGWVLIFTNPSTYLIDDAQSVLLKHARDRDLPGNLHRRRSDLPGTRYWPVKGKKPWFGLGPLVQAP